MRHNGAVARTGRLASPGDMVRSLAVILVPIVVITVLFTRNPGEDAAVREVQWRPVLAEARREAPYPVLAPTNLPDGWRPTRASWVRAGEPYLNGAPSARNAWELGFLTPDDIYIAVEQGDLRPQDLVAEATRGGRVDGASDVDGQRWERRVSADQRTRSLVLAKPEVTTVVVGDLPYAALEAYAATLRDR